MKPFLIPITLLLLVACGRNRPVPVQESPPPQQAPSAPTAAASFTFEAPSDWISSPPSGSMRIAQWTLPGEAGPAEAVVFHFAGGGGTQANLERWAGQVPVEGEANPLESAILFEGMAGPYRTASVDKANDEVRIIATVIETEGDPWFFKLTGPPTTLGAHLPAYKEALATFRP